MQSKIKYEVPDRRTLCKKKVQYKVPMGDAVSKELGGY